jgi:ribosomal protein L18
LQGDIVFASAYSSELPKYGIKHGLKNWAAAYATGLLVARRALTKIGLAEKYEGVKEPDGSHTMTEEIEDAGRPFKVFLDVGLRKTSTGSRVFGAMKGASDGGLYIPHSENRFPGYDSESKALDADTLKKYIYGGHIGEVLNFLCLADLESIWMLLKRMMRRNINVNSPSILMRILALIPLRICIARRMRKSVPILLSRLPRSSPIMIRQRSIRTTSCRKMKGRLGSLRS